MKRLTDPLQQMSFQNFSWAAVHEVGVNILRPHKVAAIWKNGICLYFLLKETFYIGSNFIEIYL